MSFFSRFFKPKKQQLEKTKQELLADLSAKGIRNLVEQMENEAPYSPLIAERIKSGSWSSEDSVSWHAFQYSNTLSSPDDKKELLQLLSDPAYADKRLNIFRCLACLCSNTQDLELFQFLMQVVDKEDDDHILVSILSRLRDMKKPAGINLAPLKRLLSEGTGQSRVAAAMALRHTNDPEVETLLLDEFKWSGKETQSRLCLTFESIGTKQSIPALRAAWKKTRDRAFRMDLERVIAAIEERERT